MMFGCDIGTLVCYW